MQANKITYEVFGLTEKRRHHPLYAAQKKETEELFFGTCDSKVGGVGVLINTNLTMYIKSFQPHSNRFEGLQLKFFGPTSALTIFMRMHQRQTTKDEIEAIYVKLEKFHIVRDFNAEIGANSPEELHIGTLGLEWND